MIRRMNEDEIEARKRRGLHICIMSCNAMSYPPLPPHTHTTILFLLNLLFLLHFLFLELFN